MSGMTSTSQDPIYLFLRGLFATSSRRALVASLVSAGCGAVPDDDGPDFAGVSATASSSEASEPAFAPLALKPTCDGVLWRPLTAIAPTIAPNYVAWRSGAQIHQQLGVRCEGAEDPRVCEAAVRYVDTHGTSPGYNVLSTTGDNVETWRDATLLDLLGVVDTADEALMLAAAAGYLVSCYGAPNDLDPSASQLNAFALPDGWELWLNPSFDTLACGIVSRYRLHVSSSGQITELAREDRDLPCPPSLPAMPGRRPPGLVITTESRSGPSRIGARVARDAHYEAASVPAFEILARELAMHGAPASLRRRALDAADDEVRHAQMMTNLANRFGASVSPHSLAATRCRGLTEVVLDNAVEGCIGETFAAMLATFQSINCPDVAVRAAMRSIAADETEHAAFSWHLHRWGTMRIGETSQRRVRAAQRAALRRLRADTSEPRPVVASALGLPTLSQRRQLLDSLEAGLLG